MTEALTSSQRLEALLDEVVPNNIRSNDILPLNQNRENISQLSRMFLDMFEKGNFRPDSLDVVLPGGSFYEIVGVWLAATAAGIQTVHVTALEQSSFSFAANASELGYQFKQQLRMYPSHVSVMNENGSLTLRHADALARDNRPPFSSDAIMVFMGNAEPSFGPLFNTFAMLGQETGKPLLFAATATALPGDVESIESLYTQARQRGGLRDIPGMVGRNHHALQHPRMGSMTHSFVFAGVRGK